MNVLILIAALALLSCGAVAVRRSRSEPALRTAARAAGAFLLLILTCLSAFGFFASYEYPTAADRLPWQFGYGLLAVGALIGAVRVAFGALRKMQQ